MMEDHTQVITPHRGRRTTLCVTDCATMANCNKLAVATTARELAFYDLSTTVYTCQYHVHGKTHTSLVPRHSNSWPGNDTR